MCKQCIIAYSRTKRSLYKYLHEIVLTLFIQILAITNFWADTFIHLPSKLLQQILSTKKFNDPSFAACLFSLAFYHCAKILKDHFVTYRVDFGAGFPTMLCLHRQFSVL